MSIGHGGRAYLVLEDDETVIYEYGGYNLNIPKYRNENLICDGIITIQKSCFLEPEIHEKRKKMPSGRKRLVVKRVPVRVDYEKAIKDGLIIVENCSNCWRVMENVKNADVMACRILFHMFLEYQKESIIPKSININF